jgi:hypothetical protein
MDSRDVRLPKWLKYASVGNITDPPDWLGNKSADVIFKALADYHSDPSYEWVTTLPVFIRDRLRAHDCLRRPTHRD